MRKCSTYSGGAATTETISEEEDLQQTLGSLKTAFCFAIKGPLVENGNIPCLNNKVAYWMRHFSENDSMEVSEVEFQENIGHRGANSRRPLCQEQLNDSLALTFHDQSRRWERYAIRFFDFALDIARGFAEEAIKRIIGNNHRLISAITEEYITRFIKERETELRNKLTELVSTHLSDSTMSEERFQRHMEVWGSHSVHLMQHQLASQESQYGRTLINERIENSQMDYINSNLGQGVEITTYFVVS